MMKGFATNIMIVIIAFLFVIVLGILFFTGRKTPTMNYQPLTNQENQAVSPEPTLSTSNDEKTLEAEVKGSTTDALDSDLSEIEKDLKEL